MDSDRRLKEAVKTLKEYGAKRVFLFGSAARGTSGDYSDIDLACEGLSPEQFFKVLGRLLATTGRSVDLVDIEEVKDTIQRRIEREGILLYEAKGSRSA